ncbi:MAG: TraL conjugative transposon family protein [Bacteroidota bacterium]|nr:TraL conjugative transposon family protein [Bacteroidota bacterium]MDP4268515.1 TraL conjugative transposon family protein [Bacteroidota bacterium]
MYKIKQTVARIRNAMDDGLQRMCGALSPDKRVTTVIIMIAVFGTISLYITISSIYNIGWRDACIQYGNAETGSMSIQHIQQLKIVPGTHVGSSSKDIINNQLNQPMYERK